MLPLEDMLFVAEANRPEPPPGLAEFEQHGMSAGSGGHLVFPRPDAALRRPRGDRRCSRTVRPSVHPAAAWCRRSVRGG